MEFGLHIADFTWSGGQRELGPALARHVRNAEAAGIQRITVMDHFWQLPGIGPVEHEMLEAYATLGFIVAHTEKALLHTLVTGVIYREPALLAKQVTTLDVLSGGRVGLGIGAAWNEQESRGLGFAFPPVAERFRKLEETIQICLQMWAGRGGAVRGRDLAARAHAQLAAEHHATASVPHDRRRRRAQDPAARRSVRGCLQPRRSARRRRTSSTCCAAHCDDVGRDYDDIEKTAMIGVNPESTRVERRGDGRRSSRTWASPRRTCTRSASTSPTRVVDVIAGAAERVG